MAYNLEYMAPGLPRTTKIHAPWHRLRVFLVLLTLAIGSCLPGRLDPPPPVIAITQAVAIDDVYRQVNPTGQTIRFWHPFSKTRQAALEAIVNDFNADNEWDILVQLENQESYSQITRKLMGVLNTDDAPDLIAAYPDQAASYQLAGGLVDLDALLTSPQWGLTQAEQADFWPGFLQQEVYPTFGNARLSFPAGRALDVLVYNADWLAALGYSRPPETPAQFQEMACKASQAPFAVAEPGAGAGYELGLDASHFASWTYAFGGQLYDKRTNRYRLDGEAARSAMNFLQSLIQAGCARLPAERYAGQVDFGQGRLLFLTESSASLASIGLDVTRGAQFNWSVAALPHTTSQPALNTYGSSLSIPHTRPEKELAAWLFIRYFSSPAVQAEWSQAAASFPVRVRAAGKMQAYFEQNPAYQTAFSLLPFARSEPPVPGYEPVREKIMEAMAAIMAGADTASTLAALNAEANQILVEHQAAWLPTPIPAEGPAGFEP